MMAGKQFRKYGRIPHIDEVPHLLENSVEVYEKIDGGNVQIRKVEGRVLCGSRAHFLTREEYFTQPWFKDFQKWALGNYSFYNLPENFIVYGEWNSKHTLDYKPEFTDRFFFLDLFDLSEDKFVSYGNAKGKLLDLGVEDVIYLKPVFEGHTNFDELEKMISGSDYREGDKEGLVIKNYWLQEFAKLWTSSVKKRGVVTQSDVNSIYLSLVDAGELVSRDKLIEELEGELVKSGRHVSDKRIVGEVEKFCFDNFLE